MAREHRFFALIAYRLDEAQARLVCEGPEGPPLMFTGPPPIDPTRAVLTADMVDQEKSAVVCYVCEISWAHAKDVPCPGEPKGYLANGMPYHPGLKLP